MKTAAPGLQFEIDYRAQGLGLVAGIDEAGRGAWAGPVAAGAVILPLDNGEITLALKDVRDSKKCSARLRDTLDAVIRENATAVSVGMASSEEIDQIGIAPATRLAMRRAIEGLTPEPQALLIDWVRLRDIKLPQRSFPKGESLSLSVAAASIAAKVARDRLMISLDAEYPGYNLSVHKGYGTRAHQKALKDLGPSPIHRRSFAPIRLHLLDDVNEPGPRS